MSKLSSESERRSRRDTMLGFQPPAIGDEEIAAVAETLRSGWLTTGPRAAELERRIDDGNAVNMVFHSQQHYLLLAVLYKEY
jgi:hypothetical protein